MSQPGHVGLKRGGGTGKPERVLRGTLSVVLLRDKPVDERAHVQAAVGLHSQQGLGSELLWPVPFQL